jgi:polar amino acid transport system substrate-binding protein
MSTLRRGTALVAGMLVVAACSGGTGDIPATVCAGDATTYFYWLTDAPDSPTDMDPVEEPASTDGDLLETIQENGVLRVATDANYEPQSFREPDGSWVGFDIDVAAEIAERLGVEVEYQHQEWDLITAGTWNERWDISVGSMTITTGRKDLFSFAQPYYYTPAYLAASERSGITSMDDVPFAIPDEVEAITRETDANCIEDIEAGRTEFDLLMTSGTVIDAAVDAGQPIVKIGDPIFSEQLAVAFDKAGPEHAALLYEVNTIIGEMHEDGTLTALSEQWYDGDDLTQDPAASN